MRKLMIIGLAVLLAAGFAACVIAQEKPKADETTRGQELRQIRMQILQIEQKTVSEDPELKGIRDQMEELRKKRRARLDTLLKDNQEYQDLRKKEQELAPRRPRLGEGKEFGERKR